MAGEFSDFDEVVTFGNPWHGWVDGGAIQLPNGGTKASSMSSAGPDTVLVRFSGIEPVETSETETEAGMQWRTDAVLYADQRRYSPFSSKGIGAWAWLYRATDGTVWRCRFVPTIPTGNQVSGASVSISFVIKASRFGRIGEPAEVEVDISSGALAFTMAQAGYIIPMVVNPSPDGSAVLVTTRTSPVSDNWTDEPTSGFHARQIRHGAAAIHRLTVSGGGEADPPLISASVLVAQGDGSESDFQLEYPLENPYYYSWSGPGDSVFTPIRFGGVSAAQHYESTIPVVGAFEANGGEVIFTVGYTRDRAYSDDISGSGGGGIWSHTAESHETLTAEWKLKRNGVVIDTVTVVRQTDWSASYSASFAYGPGAALADPRTLDVQWFVNGALKYRRIETVRGPVSDPVEITINDSEWGANGGTALPVMTSNCTAALLQSNGVNLAKLTKVGTPGTARTISPEVIVTQSNFSQLSTQVLNVCWSPIIDDVSTTKRYI
jgi:hypothetical protein